MATATRYLTRGGLRGRVHSTLRGGEEEQPCGVRALLAAGGGLWLKRWVSVLHVYSEWQDNRILIHHVFRFVCSEPRPLISAARSLFVMDGEKKKKSLWREAVVWGKSTLCLRPKPSLISASRCLLEVHVLWDVLQLENLHLSHRHSGWEALNKLHSCIICLPVIFFHHPGYSTVFKILPWQAICVESLWKHACVFDLEKESQFV